MKYYWKKILFFSWLLLGFMTFFSSFQEQIIISKTLQKQFNILFPEGWGFFTKNPREPSIKVYKIAAYDTIEFAMSNQLMSNYLGLSRKSRIKGYEASILVNEVPNENWVETNRSKLHSESLILTRLKSKEGFRYLKKGVYLFEIFEPIPFAWSKNNQEKFNPLKISKIELSE